MCLPDELRRAGVAAPLVDRVVPGRHRGNHRRIRIVAAPSHDTGARCAIRVRLAAWQIGANRADHHTPSGAAEHRGIDRLTSRHPHPECSIDRRHQCLRDRPCRVVSANAPTERGRCSGKRRRGRHHHEQRHECGGFRCRGCAINRNATACISQNQWPETVGACARTYAEPAAAECGWSTNQRAAHAQQRTPLRLSPVRSASHHR